MHISNIVNSVFNSLTYMLSGGNGDCCWLVDCGDVEKIIDTGMTVRGVLLTHCHYDHIYGLNKLVEAFPDAMVYTNEFGKAALSDTKWNFSHYHPDADDFIFWKPQNVVTVSEGDKISLDGFSLTVLETPGHDPSCISYLTDGAVFTGDSYIPGVKVVTTFPKSDKALAEASLRRITEISKDIRVYPGHKI